jgi:hypothetical protein
MIENLSPFCAELVPSFDVQGLAQTIVVVKGVFDLQGRLRCPLEAVPVWTADVYCEGPEYPQHAVRFEADWAPVKPLTDLIVSGHAYAPSARAVKQFEAGLQVGTMKPVIARVFGPRHWSRRLMWTLSGAEPAQRVPLASWTPWTDPDAAHGTLPANPFEWTGEPQQTPDSQSAPAGFGVCGRAWLPRRSYAGSYARNAKELARGLASGMPPNFDTRYWNCAHPRLQYAKNKLRPGTEIRLLNMSAQGQTHVVLPAVPLAIALTDGSLVRPDFDTVIIEPDGERVILTWRHTLARTPVAQAGRVTVHLSAA